MTVLAILIAGGLAYLGARAIVTELKANRVDAARARQIALIALFAPSLDAAQRDARALLVWEPLARRARALAADDMRALDAAFGGAFPFSRDTIQAAHAQWSADWLAWEQAHDAEYKLKAKEVEHDRARLDLVDREKLDRYQRRYQEYVQVSKALQALLSAPRD